MTIGQRIHRLTLGLCCVAIAGLALQGCRSEEQGRVLQYDKGTYLGKTDEQLEQGEVNDLRLRVSSQSGV